MKIGFIGLGNMGSAIVKGIHKQRVEGIELLGYNPHQEKAVQLEQQKQFHMLILENLRFCVTFLLSRQNYFRMYQQLQSLVMNAMVDPGEHLRYRQEHRMM